MLFALFFTIGMALFVSALTRIFYPELYARYVLRITTKEKFAQWSTSSTKVGSIAVAIAFLLFLLLAISQHR